MNEDFPRKMDDYGLSEIKFTFMEKNNARLFQRCERIS